MGLFDHIGMARESLEQAWKNDHQDVAHADVGDKSHTDTAKPHQDTAHIDSGSIPSVWAAMMSVDPTSQFPPGVATGSYSQTVGVKIDEIIGSATKYMLGADMKVMTDPKSFLASMPLLPKLLSFLPLLQDLGVQGPDLSSWGDSKWLWGGSTTAQYGMKTDIKRGGETKHTRTGWIEDADKITKKMEAKQGLERPHKDSAHQDGRHDDTTHGDTHQDVVGHADTPHGDTHTDQPAHADNQGGVHGDTLHQDVPRHNDSPHGDTHQDVRGHADTPHGDTHQDVKHQDVAHTDHHQDHGDSHTDNHSDAQTDNHTDDRRPDHTDNVHTDSNHTDNGAHTDHANHQDNAHSDHQDTNTTQPHTDGHADSGGHSDAGHSDATHQDGHSHNDHNDHIDNGVHDDVGSKPTPHGDAPHTDTSHRDVAHTDTGGNPIWPLPDHQDSSHYDHTDSHQDSHADGHQDDVHKDTAHGDTPHADAAHADAGHQDQSHTDHADQSARPNHGDAAHADAAHADFSHVDTPAKNVAHGDMTQTPSHTDGSGPGGWHSDTPHTDTPHSDTAHGDRPSPHADAPHVDTAHGDAAHGDDANHQDTSTEQVVPLGGKDFQKGISYATAALSFLSGGISMGKFLYHIRKEFADFKKVPLSTRVLQGIDFLFLVTICLIGGFIMLTMWAIAAIVGVNYKSYKTSGYAGPKQVPFYLTNTMQTELVNTCLTLVQFLEDLGSQLTEIAHFIVYALQWKSHYAAIVANPRTALKKAATKIPDAIDVALQIIGFMTTTFMVIDTVRETSNNLDKMWKQKAADNPPHVDSK